jgi:hypothetical protein
MGVLDLVPTAEFHLNSHAGISDSRVAFRRGLQSEA